MQSMNLFQQRYRKSISSKSFAIFVLLLIVLILERIFLRKKPKCISEKKWKKNIFPLSLVKKLILLKFLASRVLKLKILVWQPNQFIIKHMCSSNQRENTYYRVLVCPSLTLPTVQLAKTLCDLLKTILISTSCKQGKLTSLLWMKLNNQIISCSSFFDQIGGEKIKHFTK